MPDPSDQSRVFEPAQCRVQANWIHLSKLRLAGAIALDKKLHDSKVSRAHLCARVAPVAHGAGMPDNDHQVREAGIKSRFAKEGGPTVTGNVERQCQNERLKKVEFRPMLRPTAGHTDPGQGGPIENRRGNRPRVGGQ